MNKKIDIQKYEGHTEGPWEFKHINSNWYRCDEIGEIHMEDIAIKEASANAQLIADAPLILDAYKKKCNEAKWLREALQIITKDLDSAIAQGHIPIRATNGIDVTKIRNFANDASI